RVAPPSNMADILSRRALSAGRLAALGATLDLHHGLLGSIAILLFMSAVVARAQLPQAPPPPPPGLAPAPAPPPPVRTRYFTSLTNLEVERYLQYNDVIFVPIGNAQARGVLPIDCEYVAAEA